MAITWLKRLFKGKTADTPSPYTTHEACAEALGLIAEAVQARKGVLPADLSVVIQEVFPKLPVAVRDADTAENRAEMASALQGLIIGYYWMRRWMED